MTQRSKLPVAFENPERLGGAHGRHDLVTVGLEILLEEPRDVGLVVDDEDPARTAARQLSPRAGPAPPGGRAPRYEATRAAKVSSLMGFG